MNTSILPILVLAIGVTGAGYAATPAAKPAAKPPVALAAKPMALSPGVRRITLSPDGSAIAQRIMGAPDPRIGQIQTEIASIKQEQLKLIAGPTVDIDKLEPLLRREEALLSEVRSRKNDRMIQLLRALGDADRVALLQTLANPAQLQNSAPAPAGGVAPPTPGR